MRTGSRKLTLLVSLFLIWGIDSAFAGSPTIFEVRQPLAMAGDKPMQKDYYINSGSESGLKPGYVVTVTRRLSLHDKFKNQSAGDLVVPVGRLKIIHAQTGLSVGRMYSLYTRENVPVLDYDFIMVGDRLDLATAKMVTPRKGKSKKLRAKSKRSAAAVKKKIAAAAAASYRPPVAPVQEPKPTLSALPTKLPEKKVKAETKLDQVSKNYRPQPVDGPALQ